MLERTSSHPIPSSAPRAAEVGASTSISRVARPAASNPPPGVLPHLVDFFSRGDGTITLGESIHGFHRLGIGMLGATAVGVAVNFGLGALTLSNPFALPVSKMPRGKHASDTDIIRPDGSTDTRRLDEVCRKYFGARGELDALGLAKLLKDDLLRDLGLGSLVGLGAALGELGLLWALGGQVNERGVLVLKEERFRAFYEDPSVFYQIEAEQAAAAHKREQTPVGWVVNQFRKFIV